MPFNSLFFFLFAFLTLRTTLVNHCQFAILGANAVAARGIPATDVAGAPKYETAAQSKSSRKRSKREAQTQTLTGTVEWEYKPLSWDCDVPNCDHFALYDDATQTNYELDDARAALPYEGKRAKVTGVVDTKNNTIHLISIEAWK
jgi:hypothetical protein